MENVEDNLLSPIYEKGSNKQQTTVDTKVSNRKSNLGLERDHADIFTKYM